MSSGAFQDGKYVDDLGVVHPIRVQPETITAWNANGAGTITAGTPSAQVSQSKRALGVNARTARFKWAATPPAGYLANSIIAVPILTKTAFDALVKGVDYPYLGTGLNLVGKTNESIK